MCIGFLQQKFSICNSIINQIRIMLTVRYFKMDMRVLNKSYKLNYTFVVLLILFRS